jgi:hypothetical protein
MKRMNTSVHWICLLMLTGLGSSTALATGVVGEDAQGGQVWTSESAGSGDLINSEVVVKVPSSGESQPEAVIFSGCILPGRTITYRIRLPAFGRYLHTVIPGAGFNVAMGINYPGLSRYVNRFGPGRSEAFTVITGPFSVIGRVTISGVRGSFGCYRFSVFP